MTRSRVVLVLGGGPSDRAAATAELLADAPGRALVLTGHPDAVDARLDVSEHGPVEVRVDDPSARLEAYRSGAADPDDVVLAALSAGDDTPLAAVLGWEYARRAAIAGWWGTVVVELEGDLAAVRRIAAAGRLAAFVEARWPAHVRFASMAAGERAEARLREAHRLSLLVTDVVDFLSGAVEVVLAGVSPEGTAALVELARGAVVPEVRPDGEGGFRLAYPAPAAPDAPVAVEDDGLRVEHAGVRALLPLSPLLRRCVPVGSGFDAASGLVRVDFVPDPALWPPDLVPSGPADRCG